MVYDNDLKVKQQNLLAEIRNIVGKVYTFSDAYIKKKGGMPRMGRGMMPYGKITKKYVYCSCRAVYGYNDNDTEYGVYISKYSLLKRDVCENVNKIALEDLFISDLQTLRDEIVFSLWWEATVRYLKLTAELIDCKKYVKLFEKVENGLPESRINELIA
jgi:hypothetical protein